MAIWRWGLPLSALFAMGALFFLNANVAVFLWLNHHLMSAGDYFWNHLTVLGEIGIVCMLPFLGRRPEIVWQFAISGLLAALWTNGLKAPLAVLRPPAVLLQEQFHLIGPMLERHSFPSGHTTTTFVIVGVLCLQKISPQIKAGLLLLAVAIGLSRIACGVHWPLDVLGGMFGGWISAVAGTTLGQRWRAGERPGVQRGLAFLFMALAVWFLGWYVSGQTGTRSFEISVVLIAMIFAVPGLLRLFVRKKADE